jgi:hypothetical protein
MKKTIKTTSVAFAALALTLGLTFTSCKKGDTGPAGDKGATGNTGATGATGNANVTSITLNANSWTWDGVEYWRSATWTGVSQLTSAVVNSGAVMLYQNDGNGYFAALPITANISATVQEHDFFIYSTNTISVFIENSDLSDPNPPPFSYKLVCIPPAIIKSNPKLDLKNYNEVKQVLNLKD